MLALALGFALVGGSAAADAARVLYGPDWALRHKAFPPIRSRALGPGLLAPRGATISRTLLGRRKGTPQRLLVLWLRDRGRTSTMGAGIEQGVIVWERATLGRRRPWRLAYARRFPGFDARVRAELQDITRDGAEDVLLDATQGSGACGTVRLVGSLRTSVRELFARTTCETSYHLTHTTFVLWEPVGPCPIRNASAHCSGGERTLVERWNGSRLTVVRSTIRCSFAGLDPARGCRR